MPQFESLVDYNPSFPMNQRIYPGTGGEEDYLKEKGLAGWEFKQVFYEGDNRQYIYYFTRVLKTFEEE